MILRSGASEFSFGGVGQDSSKTRLVWTLAWKGAFSLKFRTWLTLIGLAMGTFALTTFGSMVVHFHKMASRFENYAEGKIFIRDRSGFFGAGAIEKDELLTLSQMAGVKEVIPMIVARLHSRELMAFGLPQIVLGVPKEKLPELFKDTPLLWGSWPENSGDSLLGIDVAEEQGNLHSSSFTYAGKKFRVSGVMARTDGPEDHQVTVPLSDLEKLLGREGLVSYGVVIPKPGESASALAQLIGNKHSNWDVLPPTLVSQGIRGSERLWGALTMGVGFLTVLIGGIGILTVMMMAVRERIREIAILKVLGASRSQIFLLFLFEAFILSLLGSVAGLLLGMVFILGVSHPLARQGMVLFEPTTLLIFLSFFLALVLSLLGGLYPAFYGAKIKPADVLRT